MIPPAEGSSLNLVQDPMNPLIPTAYDIVWSAASVALAALMIIALISLARRAKNLTTTQSLIWTVLVIFVPVLGPLAWLFIGRPAAAKLSSGPPQTDAAS